LAVVSKLPASNAKGTLVLNVALLERIMGVCLEKKQRNAGQKGAYLADKAF